MGVFSQELELTNFLLCKVEAREGDLVFGGQKGGESLEFS